MPTSYAGFDRISATVSAVGNDLQTDHLGNCIGVGAYNQTQGLIRFAHYDTQHVRPESRSRSAPWSPGDLEGLKAEPPSFFRLNKLKILMRTGWGFGDDVRYAIALGFVWQPGVGPEENRTEMVKLLSQVFRCRLFHTKGAAKFSVKAGEPWIDPLAQSTLPALWQHAGTVIDYNGLT